MDHTPTSKLDEPHAHSYFHVVDLAAGTSAAAGHGDVGVPTTDDPGTRPAAAPLTACAERCCGCMETIQQQRREIERLERLIENRAEALPEDENPDGEVFGA